MNPLRYKKAMDDWTWDVIKVLLALYVVGLILLALGKQTGVFP